jgi:predicted metalloprotease
MARWLRFAISFVALATLAFQGQTTVVGASTGSQIKPDPLTLEETIDLSVEDIQAYWAKQYPATFKGRRYQPIASDRIFPYDSTTGTPPCGEGGPRPYVRNAFYCGALDTVSYDVEGLFPDAYFDFGNFAVAMILAHEWGHAIQERSNVGGLELLDRQGVPSILVETQADCYAGTWARRLDDKKSKLLELEAGDLDAALSGILSVADAAGQSPDAPTAHGSAFDRVTAFQQGFDHGANRCATWFKDHPDFVEVPFTTVEDLATGGNLPVDELIPLVTTDLDEYWASRIDNYEPVSSVIPYDLGTSSSLPTCGDEEPIPENFKDTIFYCSVGDFVAWDAALLADTAERYGDFAAATLIANRWSNAVHSRIKSKAKGKAETLESDCLTGSWAGSLLDETRRPQLSLSPGDLDEAIQTTLKFNSSTGKGLSAFDRTKAFRKGFSDGARACVKSAKQKGK